MPKSASDIEALIRALEGLYGKPIWVSHGPPLEELISCILSQHTSDKNSHRAYQSLRQAFPTWESILDAPASEVADTIRHGGLANQKAPRIQAVLRAIQERSPDFDMTFLEQMETEEARQFLMSLPGIGPKCAAIVLCFSLGRNVIPVDTHVFRVSWRLGLIPQSLGEAKAHDALQQQVPDEIIYSFHVCLIRHGRMICKAPKPRCEQCPIQRHCDYFNETIRGETR